VDANKITKERKEKGKNHVYRCKRTVITERTRTNMLIVAVPADPVSGTTAAFLVTGGAGASVVGAGVGAGSGAAVVVVVVGIILPGPALQYRCHRSVCMFRWFVLQLPLQHNLQNELRRTVYSSHGFLRRQPR